MSSISETSTVNTMTHSTVNVDTPLTKANDKDPCLTDEERRFYEKAYPTVDLVRDRKVHCTVCKAHIGTAPIKENSIKMHPILRVTHCLKCHDFYNSGEFSKGEDGSELYCRWCGQGGEVYCCSSCPYVFCKMCIIKNLSRGVIVDIEQNENWNCFRCAPKILWPLRAQHWALMQYIEQQKKQILSLNLSDTELKKQMTMDRTKCCRLAKAKCGNMSDSSESLDSITSRRSYSISNKKKLSNNDLTLLPGAKRVKNNDEVVCTPDLMSMLEPDCQITLPQQKISQRPVPSPNVSAQKGMSLKQGFGNSSLSVANNVSGHTRSSVPPPLVLRNTGIKIRPGMPTPIVRRTIIGPRTPTPIGNGTPVYHTINGYRIDLNSAAQQETFRLPNGKLIQVKRQGTLPVPSSNQTNNNTWQLQQQQRPLNQSISAMRQVHITQNSYPSVNMQQQQQQTQRYHNSSTGHITPANHNGVSHMQIINGQLVPTGSSAQTTGLSQSVNGSNVSLKPVMIRHTFPDTPIGQARSKLQEQVFNAMEICTHLSNKVQTLTNANAYKQARNYLEVKELYIHLSYLLTYAIGRFKGLQDKCLADMRQLGFGSDADCLENGQLAAGVDYVCYGQLDDVDLFNNGSNSFHNQVYEYRKSLHANLKDEDGSKSPLPPLFPLGSAVRHSKRNNNDNSNNIDVDKDGGDAEEDSLLEDASDIFKGHWLKGRNNSPLITGDNDENDDGDDILMDNDNEDDDGFGGSGISMYRGTEDSMRRSEETHAFDRKLTRLVSQYPSIWCTRHPDYGNFEVTRKQWNIIAAHFRRSENIKLRWKNIRKRFVRIEKRIAEGKRFNGHFDKAMAFLANRDLPEDQWVPVDCGDDDGDTYDRHTLDAIERSLTLQGKDEFAQRSNLLERETNRRRYCKETTRPIDIKEIDLRIINYVKANAILWRKSMDPEVDKQDELNRMHLWNQLKRHFPQYSCDEIKDRWQHLYEMYKTFRLKTIKSSEDRSLLELKYSKYLAKLYFLYKIDEEEMRSENMGLFEDCFELDEDEEDVEEELDEERKLLQQQEQEHRLDKSEKQKDQGDVENLDGNDNNNVESQIKLQDMSDDKEFLEQLVRLVQQYPAIWNAEHPDYIDIMIRDNYWQEINEKLTNFKHKQASDDEDNECEIVEPKTDLITLDSDDDEVTTTNNSLTSNNNIKNNSKKDNIDIFAVAQNFLATMLEVDMPDDSNGVSQSPLTCADSFCTTTSIQKKQPRRKTTCKPNPTLIRKKQLLEVEKLKDMKRNDPKLKMNCVVKLRKAEEEYIISKEEFLQIQNKLNVGLQAEDELIKNKNACSVKINLRTTMLEHVGSSCDIVKESLNLKVVIKDAATREETIQKSREISNETNHHSYITSETEDHNSKGKLLNEDLSTNATVQVQNGHFFPNKEMEIKGDTQEDDGEDLDVDKEIAKVLKNCNLNRSLNNCNGAEKMTIKANTTTINQSFNLRDTVDRTIEKLIVSGIEDVNDNTTNPYTVEEMHRHTDTEAT